MRTGRSPITVALVATAAIVIAGLAGCGNDDGADLRNLTEETAIPSGGSD